MPRTIVVGDVHGCVEELLRLLEGVRYAQGSDRLILVGDLVARGPDSHGAVANARRLGALAVRGNHDEKVLAWWRVARDRGRKAASKRVSLGERHALAARQLDDDDFEFLEALPFVIPLSEHGAVVVHAGFDARVGLSEQDPHTMMNIRSIDSDGTPTRKLTSTGWASVWPGPEHVLFGHDARRGIQLEPRATGLDSGCCYGRALTAMVLQHNQIVPQRADDRRRLLVQEPAREAYCPMGDGNGPE